MPEENVEAMYEAMIREKEEAKELTEPSMAKNPAVMGPIFALIAAAAGMYYIWGNTSAPATAGVSATKASASFGKIVSALLTMHTNPLMLVATITMAVWLVFELFYKSHKKKSSKQDMSALMPYLTQGRY